MNRKPLGRGLDALIGTAAGASAAAPAPAENEARSGVLEIAIDRIMPNRFQPRLIFFEAAMAELVESIKQYGILEPLIARPAPAGSPAGIDYELVAGERRMRAAREAGLAAVPLVIRELGDRDAIEVALVENIVRHELSAVEEGRAFHQLWKKFAMSHDDIAARIGKSRSYVTNQIRLLELPPEVCEMVVAGDLSATLARTLLAFPEPAERIKMARDMVASRMTTRDLDDVMNKTTLRRATAINAALRTQRKQADANLSALEDNLRRALKRKVHIVRKRGRKPGRLEIEFYDDRDLDALASRLLDSARASTAA